MEETDGLQSVDLADLPRAGKQERVKTGRKVTPRAKLTMSMLASPSGVDALLENLKGTRFSSASLF